MGVILCALSAKWCRPLSNASGLRNDCTRCRDFFTSSRVRIAQLSLVARLEIQIPNSGLQNDQRRPSFHFPVRFFVIGYGACLFYSGAWESNHQKAEEDNLNGKKRRHCPWLVYGEFCQEDSERRKAIKWPKRQSGRDERERESKWRGKMAWARDWWMKWWMTGGRESISSTMLWQPRCCRILLACAAGANRTPLPDTVRRLYTHPTCAPMFIQTHWNTHILLISLLPPPLVQTSPWDWLEGLCMYMCPCRNVLVFYFFIVFCFSHLFSSCSWQTLAVIKQMSLGNGKTQGDISASNSPAPALWGRLEAECVCLDVLGWGFFYCSISLLLAFFFFFFFQIEIEFAIS